MFFENLRSLHQQQIHRFLMIFFNQKKTALKSIAVQRFVSETFYK